MSDNKTHVEFVKVNESTAEFTGTVSQKDALVLEDNGWTKTLDNKWQKDGVILTKLEYAKLSRPGSIIHTHNEKVENESYNNDTLWIESCKINDVYNTNEPKVKQNRTNAKKVGCIDAGEFKLRDLKRMSIGEIIDLMMFSFAKPSGYEVSLDNGALIIKEKFYTKDENEHAQYEEPRIIYIMDSDGSIKSSVSADKLDPVTHKSYDLTIKENGTDITVAPSNLYNIEVYNYNDKIYPLPIPNNEIWYTTTDKKITKTTNATGINSLNSMRLTDNVPAGDHYVMKFDKDVTEIGTRAFSGCVKLMSVTIPESVTSIGEYVFYYCSGLTSVYISDLTKWCEISFGNGESNPLYYAHNLYLNGELVTDLIIPNSVTEIGNWGFERCTCLTSLTIPSNVTSIGESAFSGCSGLTSVTIPNSVTSIGNVAFGSCSGLTSVTIPNSVTSIGESAFQGCSGLTSVTIPNSVTSIADYAFSFCSGLTSVTIPNGVTSIGYGALYGCSGLTFVTIPNSVTSIGGSAFYYCSGLTSVVIPNSVTSIGSSAFEGCSRLTSVTIGNSVTNIGYKAFYNCTGLTSITYTGTKSQWNNKITKGSYWKNYVPATIVRCTDGDINI